MATMQFLESKWIKIYAGNTMFPILQLVVDVGDGVSSANFGSSALSASIGKTVAISLIMGSGQSTQALIDFCSNTGTQTFGDDNGWKIIRQNSRLDTRYYYSHYPIYYKGTQVASGVCPGAFGSVTHAGALCIFTDTNGNIYPQTEPPSLRCPVAWFDDPNAIAINNGFLVCTIPDGATNIGNAVGIRLTPLADVNIEDISETVSDDPYSPGSPGGQSTTGGGTGNFDGTSDNIDIPSLPTLSAVDTGFITLFNPSISQLQNLASYMWGNLFDLDTWKKIFADPMDAILGLSIVPVPVPNGGQSAVTVGNISTGISMTKASAQYVAVDCGTLNVNEYWGAYLDYDPFTKAEIYLPYIGTHPLAVDDIMNKPVHVVYHVDILSGACCAYIKCGGSIIYSFVGQCSCSIPITGNDWTNVVNGALSIAASIGTMVATGGATAPMAVSAIASTAVNSMKPNVEKSGSLGGMGGMMGVQTPYLILTRPNQALPKDQNYFTGYPSFITRKLADVTGYTEIDSIHLEGVPATEQELSEIETLLKGGVIL